MRTGKTLLGKTLLIVFAALGTVSMGMMGAGSVGGMMGAGMMSGYAGLPWGWMMLAGTVQKGWKLISEMREFTIGDGRVTLPTTAVCRETT